MEKVTIGRWEVAIAAPKSYTRCLEIGAAVGEGSVFRHAAAALALCWAETDAIATPIADGAVPIDLPKLPRYTGDVWGYGEAALDAFRAAGITLDALFGTGEEDAPECAGMAAIRLIRERIKEIEGGNG